MLKDILWYVIEFVAPNAKQVYDMADTPLSLGATLKREITDRYGQANMNVVGVMALIGGFYALYASMQVGVEIEQLRQLIGLHSSLLAMVIGGALAIGCGRYFSWFCKVLCGKLYEQNLENW